MPMPEPGLPDPVPEETINRNWTELVQELRSTLDRTQAGRADH